MRLLLVAFALLWASFQACGAAEQPVAGAGFVEQARYLPASRQLVVSGWAAPDNPNVFTTNLVVRLGGTEIYRGRIERAERGDVVQSTGRADWLWSGFSIRLSVPQDLADLKPLSAAMRLGDGSQFELGIAPSARDPGMPAQPQPPSLLARLALFAALAAPGLVLLLPAPASALSRSIRIRGTAGVFGASLVLSFALLVAAGWTGSSLGLLFGERGVSRHDAIPWLGELRPVRSDEWQVLTPFAVSQASHQPPFPRINRNLGGDGQNMLIVGMTGVPVAHISALAKPATWGFFVLDLRRALSWSWWFPFFACFAAVWLVLLRLFLLDWRLAAGLALTVAASPYSVVFSGWPAYTVLFPAAGLLAADAALRTTSWVRALAAGAFLGLAVAGFAFVLYPAWQISLAYLFVPFAVAWFWTSRSRLRWTKVQTVAALVAAGVAGVLLLSWWLDARDAVASIRATVYPGQRSIEVGGDVDRWFLLKGFLSPVTMYRDSSLIWGASDAGSVALFLIPALAAVLLRWRQVRRVDLVSAALFGFAGVALAFMFFGLPGVLARWSLWGSTTSYRLDLALGVCQVLLLAWLASPAGGPASSRPATGRWPAICVAALVTLHAAWLYTLVPPSIQETVPPSFLLLALLALGGGGYLLIRDRHAAFFCVYAVVTLAAALPFNPIGVAPAHVLADPEMSRNIAPAQGNTGTAPGVAVLGERNWAMVLPAAGLPVVNSVSYYPQESLWRRLDPTGALKVVHNRYQRVLFVLGPTDAAQTYRIDSPRLDEVRVTLDAARFDFRLLGGGSVLANRADADRLAGNGSIRIQRRTPDWVLFAVLP